jgi:EAL domain-containing protein (putative c-di-GMP-specific phosphodiesterase class I)
MNLKVIADGVETEEQLQFLRVAGCDEVQGYLISKPVPHEEIAELLKRGPAELRVSH